MTKSASAPKTISIKVTEAYDEGLNRAYIVVYAGNAGIWAWHVYRL